VGRSTKLRSPLNGVSFCLKLILDNSGAVYYNSYIVNKQQENIMGYTTDFNGRVKVTPPMSAAEVKYINAFNDSRRMDREAGTWMQYIIDHFLGANPIAKNANSKWLAEHLQGHMCNGVIEAQGEEPDDQWTIVVQNNKVTIVEQCGTLPAPEEIKLLK
jgi:hypothetical protein